MFQIRFKPTVEKDIRRLASSVLDRVIQRLRGLAQDPFPKGMTKLSDSENLYRIRIGDYRIIYGVDVTEQTITIHYVRHRRDAYR